MNSLAQNRGLDLRNVETIKFRRLTAQNVKANQMEVGALQFFKEAAAPNIGIHDISGTAMISGTSAGYKVIVFDARGSV